MRMRFPAKEVSSRILIVMVSLSFLGTVSNAHAATAILTHDYELKGTLADSVGGIPLISNGGAISMNGYAFGPDQGPSFSGAINPSTYSIEMQFSLDDTSGWRRLVDFKDRTTDNGLYNFSKILQFVVVSGSGFETGPNDVFWPGKISELVITRDGGTNQFIGYVDGVQQISFEDTSEGAVFVNDPTDINNYVIHFLRDDTAIGGESGSGELKRIRIYDGVLTPTQVAQISGSPVPIPAALWLFGSALAGLVFFGKRLGS